MTAHTEHHCGPEAGWHRSIAQIHDAGARSDLKHRFRTRPPYAHSLKLNRQPARRTEYYCSCESTARATRGPSLAWEHALIHRGSQPTSAVEPRDPAYELFSRDQSSSFDADPRTGQCDGRTPRSEGTRSHCGFAAVRDEPRGRKCVHCGFASNGSSGFGHWFALHSGWPTTTTRTVPPIEHRQSRGLDHPAASSFSKLGFA